MLSLERSATDSLAVRLKFRIMARMKSSRREEESDISFLVSILEMSTSAGLGGGYFISGFSGGSRAAWRESEKQCRDFH